MLVIRNGRILSMVQPEFVGDILIDNGVIANIGNNIDAGDADVIDAAMRYVLPGLIDAHCHVGMWEDGTGDAGNDGNEHSKPITPEMRAIDGVNPFDPCFKEAYMAGITVLALGPGSANVIGGQFAAMKTYGHSTADMIVAAPVAMKAALGENPKRVFKSAKAMPYTRMAIASLLRKELVKAQEYAKKRATEASCERDLGLEALVDVIEKKLPLKIHAHRADDILTAISIAKEFDVRLSIEHCTEGYLILPELKRAVDEQGVSIVLGPLLSDRSKVELRNLSITSAEKLYNAGIHFALMTDHPVVPIQYLPICAALAVKEGLPEDEALKSITIYAAQALGLEGRMGSLEKGKVANIAVFDANPLSYTAHCTHTIVDGKLVYTRC